MLQITEKIICMYFTLNLQGGHKKDIAEDDSIY
jgi:hypothetical protein